MRGTDTGLDAYLYAILPFATLIKTVKFLATARYGLAQVSDYLIGAALIAGLGREVVGVAVGRGAALAGARGGVAALVTLSTLWGVAATGGGVRDTIRFGAGAT